ncbi:hypothetical protein Q8F55_001777 [Vanrija albida]|uniref:Uncharacterized protein n=1 Tax=Vanrija albida TaxID=181172 RepID=A0ABR3Q7Y2_9TREE
MTPAPVVMPPDSARLASELAAAPSVADACAVLEEYAWRSLLAGVRVRAYCDEANRIVQAAPPKGLRLALVSTPVHLLFPYSLGAGAPFTSFTPSVLVPAAFAHLSRKQLIDALVRLSRDGGYPASVEARTLELVLEYVGRRWRLSAAGEDIVDGITKKLAEVEFEVTLRGEPTSARATIVATLQPARFNLGFVSSAHLIARLNSTIALAAESSAAQAPNVPQMIKGWAVRRLATGAETQAVAAKLLSIRDRTLDPVYRDDILNALVTLGLESEGTGGSGVAPPLATLTPSPRNRTTSRVSLKPPPKRKTLAVLQWFPQRYGSNASAAPPVVPDWERRPSLPTLFEPAETSPTWGASDLPYLDSSTLTTSTSLPALSRTAQVTGELQTTLLRQLLGLRYSLGGNTDGWFFGSGRQLAIELLDNARGAPGVVSSLRALLSLQAGVEEFDETPPPVPSKDTPVRPATTSPTATPPSPFHQRDVSFDLDEYLEAIVRPDDSPLDRYPRESFSEVSHGSHSRQYGAPPDSHVQALSPDAGPSTVTTPPGFSFTPMPATVTPTPSSDHHRGSSLASVDSVYSNDTVTSRPLSVMSDFTICEATRVTVRAIEVRFPPRGNPLTSPGADNVEEVIQDSASEPDDTPELEAPLPHSKSMPNLDPYTALPERLSRRRRPRMPAGGLLPAFSYSPEEPAPSISRRPSTQFPCPITPPLSPVNSYDGELADTSPLALMEPLFPRKQVSNADLRSRRLKFRQWVIVDGTPTRTALSGPGSKPEVIKDQTALGAVLKLFGYGARFVNSSVLDPVEVEQALVAAIDLEALRILDRGEVFDAEARARVAWLLEQVAGELIQPDLISAVQRALEYLAAYEVGTSPRNLRHATSFSTTHADAGLEIIIPPREYPEVTVSAPNTPPSLASARPRGGFFDDLEPPSSCSSDTTLETPLGTVDFSLPTPRRRTRVQSASPSMPETPVPATRYRGGRQLDVLPSPMTPSPGTPRTPLTSAIIVHAL